MVSKYVIDSYGIEHERKNLYLIDKANGKNPDRNTHPYIKDLEEYLALEKEFKSKLKKYIKVLKKEMVQTDKKIFNVSLRLEIAKLKIGFYSSYYELTYDAMLEVKIAKLESRRLNKIIENYNHNLEEIKLYSENIKNLDKVEEKKAKKIYEEQIKIKEEEFLKEKNKLENLLNEGMISKKAFKNSVDALKIKKKDELEFMKLEIPSNLYNAKLKSAKYALDHDYKNGLKILELDISDVRRRTPIEVENVNSLLLPTSTFLLPGLGQLFNKQYFKAILFAILSLFTYLAAIPYILGYGNYQGEGIYGLYTLADGGRRLDKSIIFMIEGLIALILICIVIFIYYAAFNDVRAVLKDKLKGIRPKTYFETSESLGEEGLPYIVSGVAFILILFIVIVPILTTVFLSFTNMDPDNQAKFTWVGLKNYKLLISGSGVAGGPFWLIFGWTILWTLGATTLAIVVGFMLAIIANNERIKGKKFFRTIFLLPWAVPAFITIMYFSIMASPTGTITRLLTYVAGSDDLILIKNNANYTRFFLILMQTWLGSSYVFLLSTGVLQGISTDLYEAADIDGSTAWQKLSRITVPLVLFQTAPLMIGQYTFNFNNFSIIYLFNQGGPFLPSSYGNIAGASDLLISYIFKLTVQKNYQAAGAAITIFISIALMIIAYIGFKNSKAFKEG